jgi:hypothetical protein
MKLFEAPAIITQLTSELHRETIREAAERVMAEFDEAPIDNGQLRKVAPDIWALDGPLLPHTDGTKKGFWVFGLVLINEPGLVLFRENAVWDLPVGAVYSLDGRRVHAALAHNGVKHGKFAFLAWDADRNTDVAELLADLPESLAAWVKGEERVDIS